MTSWPKSWPSALPSRHERCRYRGRVFIYPCAGFDIVAPILAFGGQFDTFLFVDIAYRFSHFRPPALLDWNVVPGSEQLVGRAVDRMPYVENGRRRHRESAPGWRRSCHRNPRTGHTIDLVFRRRFGASTRCTNCVMARWACSCTAVTAAGKAAAAPASWPTTE